MNQYLFYTIKALDKHLNQDLIQIIWKEIRNHAGLIIQDRLLNIYLKRVARNCMIFLHLCSIVPGNWCNSLYIERFIFHTKHNLCYSYIQDPNCWTTRLLELRFNNELRPRYITMLNDIYWGIVFAQMPDL